jgi:hypothetical protein
MAVKNCERAIAGYRMVALQYAAGGRGFGVYDRSWTVKMDTDLEKAYSSRAHIRHETPSRTFGLLRLTDMRARHTPHALPAFPVYSSAFLSDNELVLGGGGGASRSGIKNKLARLVNLTQLISLIGL